MKHDALINYSYNLFNCAKDRSSFLKRNTDCRFKIKQLSFGKHSSICELIKLPSLNIEKRYYKQTELHYGTPAQGYFLLLIPTEANKNFNQW